MKIIKNILSICGVLAIELDRERAQLGKSAEMEDNNLTDFKIRSN